MKIGLHTARKVANVLLDLGRLGSMAPHSHSPMLVPFQEGTVLEKKGCADLCCMVVLAIYHSCRLSLPSMRNLEDSFSENK
jgi:Zn finger protein HypA/HybF involved in hydrogenase expression